MLCSTILTGLCSRNPAEINAWKKSSRRASSVSLKWASFLQPLRVHLPQALQQEPLNWVSCFITSPPGPGCDLWSGIQISRDCEEGTSFPGCSSLYLMNAEIRALLVFWHEIIFFPTSLSSEDWIAFSQGFIFAIVLLFPLPGAGQTESPGVKTGASVCCSDSPRRGGCDCSRGKISASLRSFSPSWLWRWGSAGLSVSCRPPRASPLVQK